MSYYLFKVDRSYGLKDSEGNIVIPAEYDEIIFVPNYFDLLFNTFQIVFRLRKSLGNTEFLYFQPGDPETGEYRIFSQLSSNKVYYFYKNYSLLDFDGVNAKRLCIDGSIDEIVLPDSGLDENNLLGLVRCNDIVNITGVIEPIYFGDETEEFNDGDLFLYELNLSSLPGYLGFHLEKEGDDVYLSIDQCLLPTSSEHGLNLGLWVNDASMFDYRSQYYNKIKHFDSYGLALVYDSQIKKISYINRYFVHVSDWFDQAANPDNIEFMGLEHALDEKYVINDGRLLKLKFSGNFIKDILLNTHKFFDNVDVAVRILGNQIKKIPFPESSLYTKFDREFAISILKSEELDTSEENILKVYNRNDFIEQLDLWYRYFFECRNRLKSQTEFNSEYLLTLHNDEFGVIPSYSFVESDFGIPGYPSDQVHIA